MTNKLFASFFMILVSFTAIHGMPEEIIAKAKDLKSRIDSKAKQIEDQEIKIIDIDKKLTDFFNKLIQSDDNSSSKNKNEIEKICKKINQELNAMLDELQEAYKKGMIQERAIFKKFEAFPDQELNEYCVLIKYYTIKKWYEKLIMFGLIKEWQEELNEFILIISQ